MEIKEIVKNNTVEFERSEGYDDIYVIEVNGKLYEFPVYDNEEYRDKTSAISFWSYIKKALAEGTFVEHTAPLEEEYNPYSDDNFYRDLSEYPNVYVSEDMAEELRTIIIEAVGDTRAEENYKVLIQQLKEVAEGKRHQAFPASAG